MKAQENIFNKVSKILNKRFPNISMYGSFKDKSSDIYSDIDLEVISDNPVKDFKFICKKFRTQENFILGYTVPFFSSKIVYSSFWNINKHPYLVDIKLTPSNTSCKGLDKIPADKYHRLCGLCWHSFVALKRKDFIELGRLMYYIRELHLLPLIEKKYKLESFKHSNKTLDKDIYQQILSTHCDFDSIENTKATLRRLIHITKDLYRRKDNELIIFILIGLG